MFCPPSSLSHRLCLLPPQSACLARLSTRFLRSFLMLCSTSLLALEYLIGASTFLVVVLLQLKNIMVGSTVHHTVGILCYSVSLTTKRTGSSCSLSMTQVALLHKPNSKVLSMAWGHRPFSRSLDQVLTKKCDLSTVSNHAWLNLQANNSWYCSL